MKAVLRQSALVSNVWNFRADSFEIFGVAEFADLANAPISTSQAESNHHEKNEDDDEEEGVGRERER